MTNEFIAGYVDLDQVTSADLQQFFGSLDTIQLMTILPPQFTYEDWVAADFDPRHQVLWWKTYASIVRRFPTAREALNQVPNHMMMKYFSMNGKSSMDLLGYTREETHMLIAHYCIEHMKKRGQWRE